MKEVVIASAARTPIGSFMGALSAIPAPQLGAIAIRAALERAGLKPDQVDEVIMGCVLTGAMGQSPARQALIKAGLSEKTGALTVSKVCGSGLKAVMLAEQVIKVGDAEVAIAGGMENMSLAPYALLKARTGYRMGNGEVIDTMIRDGLWDPYGDFHMGSAAEKCAAKFDITKADQDQFSIRSYERALAAQKAGAFKAEIAAVSVPQRKGDPIVIDTDEEPGKGNVAKLPSLSGAFQKDGTVTAGNASSINDGAAALLLMSREKATAMGVKPIARIVAQAGASLAPEWFTIAPEQAIKKALDKAKLSVSDIDLFEVNEAFAVVSVYHNRVLKLPEDRVNIHGGAVALGHPIGASGARILVTLLHAMRAKGAKRGLASLCIGGGEGVALIVEAI